MLLTMRNISSDLTTLITSLGHLCLLSALGIKKKSHLGFSKRSSYVYYECMTDRKEFIHQLFQRHYRQMYRLATILLHDDAESKDVVHDVFAQLLGGLQPLEEDTAEAFLYTCVRNRCLNVIRRRQIQERIQRLYMLDIETSILGERQLREEAAALNEAIGLLEPPVCRDIILRHFRDGLTYGEVAGELGVSETTVYKHLRRALESLRNQLKSNESV